MGKTLPRYPIYIPSKGRPDRCLTAQFLVKDNVPFHLVIESQEHDYYAAVFGEKPLLILPFSNQGSVIPARNWIKDHATAVGYERHWQLDDNIRGTKRLFRAKRINCQSGIALAVTEDFVDRYENVAIAGLNYTMFAFPPGKKGLPPFYHNVHVYSCSLILNSLPHRWRGRYNEDTDFCLQVLADGWCTILMNAFLINKAATMTMKGGNTATLYQGDGRLRMARALERRWPGVVRTGRRWSRPQHVVRDQWRKFDTPLRLKPGVNLDKMQPNEYGLKLRQVAPIKSKAIKRLLQEAGDG